MENLEFYLRIAGAISGCQLVEQELKLYLSEALDFVQKCVAGRIPFGMSGLDYKDASMERLIKIFSKLSNNQSLVDDLEIFKKERNFLSHRGIADCLDPDGEVDLLEASKFEARISAIQPESQRLRAAINNEANKFRGHLWCNTILNE
ncbi:MAG: hypothetical protein AB3X44_06890 [Leptothrix sp. (in: b-proteobacteria)]